MDDSVVITRVVLKNYKSIAGCSVSLSPLTFLVGQNGAGKSNFLDALRLVSESLNTSLEHAMRERGGINEVRRRSSGHPTHFGIRLNFNLPEGGSGFYAFKVGAKPQGGFQVQREECRISRIPKHRGLRVLKRQRLRISRDPDESFYVVHNGRVEHSRPHPLPPASDDRLFLVAASSLPEFRPLYNCFTRMGFYNLNPDEIRDLQPADAGEVLLRDGGNLASVLNFLDRQNPAAKKQIVELLALVVPGVTDVTTKPMGKKETIEFRQKMGGNGSPWRFSAENMSDGTLRALGILTALFQSFPAENSPGMPLVGIEEPELALHPGAAGVLRDALGIASRHAQILVTSHSPDLLDDKSISDRNILAVINRNGETIIGPITDKDRDAIRDRLFTAGELLRLGELTPDVEKIHQTPAQELELFDP